MALHEKSPPALSGWGPRSVREGIASLRSKDAPGRMNIQSNEVAMLTVNLLLKLADKPNRMNVSHRQINDVIRPYRKNMKRLAWAGWGKRTVREDSVSISEEGIKRMLSERIEEKVSRAERSSQSFEGNDILSHQ